MAPVELWKDRTFYLLAFSFLAGLSTSRLTTPFLIRTKIGVLLLMPIQFIMTFIVTVPCVFMELALGQYSSKSLVNVWDLCPMFRGIGYCSIATFVVSQMYNNFLASSFLLFTILSFGNEGWKSCNRTWNRPNCYTFNNNFSLFYICAQKYSYEKCEEMEWQSSMAQFVHYRILRLGTESTFIPNYELILFSLITVTFIFLANYHGVKSIEKFLIVLIILPTIQLMIMFFFPLVEIRGFTSLMFLFSEHNPSLLKDATLWIRMVKLVSSDSGLGFGVYITLGTTRPFRTPILLKSICTSLLVFGMTVIYCIMTQNLLTSAMTQHKLHQKEFYDLEKDLELPDAIFFLPHFSRFWVTLWVSNMYMINLRTLTATMCLNTEITYNSFPHLRKNHTLVVFCWCTVLFFGVVIFSTKGGYFAFKLLDQIINEVGLIFINAFKVIAIVYCYGVNKFLNDIHFMLGIKLSPGWKLFYIINPLIFGIILIYNISLYYQGKRPIPKKISAFKYMQHTFLWLHFTVIVVYAIYFIIRNVKNKYYDLFASTEDWGPQDPVLKKSREMFTGHNMTKEYVYRQARFGANRF